jgi:uncharacterized lipoprotein YddW (UPF0748 family)
MLAAYARENSERVEGLYLSAIVPAAADYTTRVIADIAGRYDVDGIHLDYARFPNDEFDYSPNALAQFRDEVMRRVSAAERRDYAKRARGRPAFYAEMFPEGWQAFRRARLTALVTQLRHVVKRARPEALFSAAVWPDPKEASAHRFQDWQGWIQSGLLDIVCPMAYTNDPLLFREQVAAITQAAGGRAVWAGIGAYRLSAAETAAYIQSARRAGADGISLFSYDNLIPSVNANPRYLQQVAQGAFGP